MLSVFEKFDWGLLGFRAQGFQKLFNELEKFDLPDLVVVETGCVRREDSWESDGSSSILFDMAAKELGARFFSIDLNPDHCAVARRLCPGAKVICGDSVKCLRELGAKIAKIDLLYLDSYDLDWKNPHPSALHHMMELCAAMPLLQPGALVFVDDNANGCGKGMYVAEYLRRIGAEQVLDDYQLGFKMLK